MLCKVDASRISSSCSKSKIAARWARQTDIFQPRSCVCAMLFRSSGPCVHLFLHAQTNPTRTVLASWEGTKKRGTSLKYVDVDVPGRLRILVPASCAAYISYLPSSEYTYLIILQTTVYSVYVLHTVKLYDILYVREYRAPFRVRHRRSTNYIYAMPLQYGWRILYGR